MSSDLDHRHWKHCAKNESPSMLELPTRTKKTTTKEMLEVIPQTPILPVKVPHVPDPKEITPGWDDEKMNPEFAAPEVE